MKNKTRGFAAITFVIIISALLSYAALTHSYDDSVRIQQVENTQQYYAKYFNEISNTNLKELTTIISS